MISLTASNLVTAINAIVLLIALIALWYTLIVGGTLEFTVSAGRIEWCSRAIVLVTAVTAILIAVATPNFAYALLVRATELVRLASVKT